MRVPSGEKAAALTGPVCPASDPTGGLRHYPQDLLKSPLDQRSAVLTVRRQAYVEAARAIERKG